MKDPFAKTSTTTGKKAVTGNTSVRVDSMREGTKSQILKDLESTSDSIDKQVITNDQLVKEIEEAIFLQTGSNSKDKAYRDLAKKITQRLRGSSKLTERMALKSGLLSPIEIVSLSDKELEEKLKSEHIETKKKTGNKPPKLPIFSNQMSIDLSESSDVKEYLKQNYSEQDNTATSEKVQENNEENKESNSNEKLETIEEINEPKNEQQIQDEKVESNLNSLDLHEHKQENNELQAEDFIGDDVKTENISSEVDKNISIKYQEEIIPQKQIMTTIQPPQVKSSKPIAKAPIKPNLINKTKPEIKSVLSETTKQDSNELINEQNEKLNNIKEPEKIPSTFQNLKEIDSKQINVPTIQKNTVVHSPKNEKNLNIENNISKVNDKIQNNERFAVQNDGGSKLDESFSSSIHANAGKRQKSEKLEQLKAQIGKKQTRPVSSLDGGVKLFNNNINNHELNLYSTNTSIVMNPGNLSNRNKESLNEEPEKIEKTEKMFKKNLSSNNFGKIYSNNIKEDNQVNQQEINENIKNIHFENNLFESAKSDAFFKKEEKDLKVSNSNIIAINERDEDFSSELRLELLSFKEKNVKLELDLETEKIKNKILQEELIKIKQQFNEEKDKNLYFNSEVEKNQLLYKIELLEKDKLLLKESVNKLTSNLKTFNNRIEQMNNHVTSIDNSYKKYSGFISDNHSGSTSNATISNIKNSSNFNIRDNKSNLSNYKDVIENKPVDKKKENKLIKEDKDEKKKSIQNFQNSQRQQDPLNPNSNDIITDTFNNGNPNIIEEVGSDNYLNMNGNIYDEIRDRDVPEKVESISQYQDEGLDLNDKDKENINLNAESGATGSKEEKKKEKGLFDLPTETKKTQVPLKAPTVKAKIPQKKIPDKKPEKINIEEDDEDLEEISKSNILK